MSKFVKCRRGGITIAESFLVRKYADHTALREIEKLQAATGSVDTVGSPKGVTADPG